MTSTTRRYPVKAKSLTLLELCQTVNDLRHASSRSSAQILTRRLYLHPLTINPNPKQQSSKIIPDDLLKVDQFNQSNLDKTTSFRKKIPYRGLAILSPSLSLASNTRFNTSIHSDNDDNNDYSTSTTTNSLNQFSSSIMNRSTSLLSKRNVFTRSLYIRNKRNINSNQKGRREQLAVWDQLDYTLERPMPRDPPTTPLSFYTLTDFHLQEQSDYNSIQQN
jgi:hypothetical protein